VISVNAKSGADIMSSIIEAARRHFGPRWKPDIKVLGREEFKRKLVELQKEIGQLQRSYERLQMADRRDDKRGPMEGTDISILSERVEAELATLHGWTVSLVETLFTLISLERGWKEEEALRKEWKLHI
jgi:hypothetical protein